MNCLSAGGRGLRHEDGLNGLDIRVQIEQMGEISFHV